ncbi:MAG: heme o synthase [Acidobacteriaceae bacterium]|jgi:protoheme IX farnesyltransferase
MLEAVAVTATSETRNQPLAAAAVAAVRTLLADYATLFKVRVSTMVIITSAAGFYLGSLRSGISPFNVGMVKALAGIAVVTCGASALNQALERKTDRLMHRTKNRPMAAGRIGLAHGLIVGFLGVFLGSLYLARATNPLTGTLTLLTAVAYVAIYTPLKQVSTINTFIGAFPGALPPLLGWTAARGVIEWPGVALFAILFVWQFPHFMAIGWMYREDYARAGVRITPTLGDTRYAARSTVIQALFYATLMVGVSLWPFALGTTGEAYAAAAICLSLGYLWYTVRFSRIGFGKAVRSPHLSEENAESDCQPARALLHASIIYLPLLLAAMMLDARGRLLF